MIAEINDLVENIQLFIKSDKPIIEQPTGMFHDLPSPMELGPTVTYNRAELKLSQAKTKDDMGDACIV